MYMCWLAVLASGGMCSGRTIVRTPITVLQAFLPLILPQRHSLRRFRPWEPKPIAVTVEGLGLWGVVVA